MLFFRTTNGVTRPEMPLDQRFVSTYGMEQWHYAPGLHLETCAAPLDRFDNPITRSIAFDVANLNQVLQGGVMHVRPGDIVWKSNRFLAEDIPTPYGMRFRVEGELLTKDGRPSEMRVAYSTGETSGDINARWRLEYFYERPLGAACFPSRIRAVSLSETAEVELADFEVLQLDLADGPSSRERFDPALVLEARPVPVVTYSNSVLYQVMPDGGLRMLERVRPAAKRLDPRTALWGLGFANLVFLAFVIRSKAPSKLQPTLTN